jgi:hypothetical protein
MDIRGRHKKFAMVRILLLGTYNKNSYFCMLTQRLINTISLHADIELKTNLTYWQVTMSQHKQTPQ